MSQDTPESSLVQQASAGDRAALSQLLLIHYDGLREHIGRRIPAELQAVLRDEDILHQTFVRAAQAIRSFAARPGSSFRGWLQTIAENLIKDAQKRRRRERRADGGRAVDDSSMATLVERVAGDSSTPAKRAQQQESVRRMHTALAALPHEQREVIERNYLQGQSLDQIAEATGRTKDSVRGICYRARKNLRALMGRSSLYFSG